MGEITEIAQSSVSVPGEAKQLAVDRTVERAKKESGSAASAVKSFISGTVSPSTVLIL
jgi:hypothetical protein